jgi:hypothetical protein
MQLLPNSSPVHPSTGLGGGRSMEDEVRLMVCCRAYFFFCHSCLLRGRERRGKGNQKKGGGNQVYEAKSKGECEANEKRHASNIVMVEAE